MSSAAQILYDSFKRSIAGISATRGALRAAELVLQSGGRALEQEALSVARFFEDTDVLESLGMDKTRALEAVGGVAGIRSHVLEHQAKSLRAAIDSSALIFMHAVLDDALFQYCRALMAADPGAWEAEVQKRKVKLETLRGRSYDAVLSEKLLSFERALERESLLVKTDHLLKRLRPRPGELEGDSYAFSKERLKRLDDLRHELVHRSGPRTLDDLEEALRFAEATLLTFFFLVQIRYPSTMDATFWGKARRQ